MTGAARRERPVPPWYRTRPLRGYHASGAFDDFVPIIDLTVARRDQDMLDAVVTAIDRDRQRRETDKIIANLRALLETLTPREREILTLVSSGLMNKQIAAELGLAEITVKIHRGHIMRKMGSKSLADLVRKAEMLGIHRVG